MVRTRVQIWQRVVDEIAKENASHIGRDDPDPDHPKHTNQQSGSSLLM